MSTIGQEWTGYSTYAAAVNQATQRAAEQNRAAALAAAMEASDLATTELTKRPEGPSPLSTTARRMHVQHVIALAHDPRPAVTIAWTTPRQPTAQLVGDGNGIYMPRRATIVACGIATIEDVCTVVHEIGHHRTLTTTASVLERERVAWEWTRAHMLSWDHRCYSTMCQAVGSYVTANRDRGAVLDVHAIETKLLSEESARQYHRPETREQLEAFEDAEFCAAHGTRPCNCGRYCATRPAVAAVVDAGHYVCRPCAEARRLDRLIAEQKTRADAMRPKAAR